MSLLWPKFDLEPRYDALNGDEKSEYQSIAEHHSGLRRKSSRFWTTLPWVTSGILMILIVVIFLKPDYFLRREILGTYEAGFSTDLSSSFKHV
jgi:hypothetical protein